MILANDNDDLPIGNTTGNPAPPIVAGVYKKRGIRLGNQFPGERLGFEIRPYYVRLDYLELSYENEKDWGGYTSLSYRLKPRMTLQLGAAMEDRKFEAPVRRYRDTTGSISLENEFTAHCTARFELQRRERNSDIIGKEYNETAAIISFSYRR